MFHMGVFLLPPLHMTNRPRASERHLGEEPQVLTSSAAMGCVPETQWERQTVYCSYHVLKQCGTVHPWYEHFNHIVTSLRTWMRASHICPAGWPLNLRQLKP